MEETAAGDGGEDEDVGRVGSEVEGWEEEEKSSTATCAVKSEDEKEKRGKKVVSFATMKVVKTKQK